MSDLTRYDINEHGELPLSYGRYVRWEDVQELIGDYEKQIEELATEVDNLGSRYDDGYDDGWYDAKKGC